MSSNKVTGLRTLKKFLLEGIALMNQNQLKREVGKAALKYVIEGEVLGVGTGSTVDCFIDALKESGLKVPACASSSVRSTKRLEEYGFKVVDLNAIESIPVYIDGADEVDDTFAMIKGAGGALTREKIVSSVAGKFVCIIDESKHTKTLGHVALPVEVIPMALSCVSRTLRTMGGNPVERDFTTDNGNRILDVTGLDMSDPKALETQINQIPGVVTVGLFAHRGADVVLVGTDHGVETYVRK